MHVPLLKWREDSFPCFLRKFLSEFDLHNSLALFHMESNVTLQSPCTCNLSDFLSSHECRTRCFKLSPVDGVLEKSPSVPTRINFTWKIYSSKQLGLSQPWESEGEYTKMNGMLKKAVVNIWPRSCPFLIEDFESFTSMGEASSELNCRRATVNHVLWFFDILSCFSLSDSIFNAWLSLCMSPSAVRRKLATFSI